MTNLLWTLTHTIIFINSVFSVGSPVAPVQAGLPEPVSQRGFWTRARRRYLCIFVVVNLYHGDDQDSLDLELGASASRVAAHSQPPTHHRRQSSGFFVNADCDCSNADCDCPNANMLIVQMLICSYAAAHPPLTLSFRTLCKCWCWLCLCKCWQCLRRQYNWCSSSIGRRQNSLLVQFQQNCVKASSGKCKVPPAQCTLKPTQ